jgi:hypothetical protein
MPFSSAAERPPIMKLGLTGEAVGRPTLDRFVPGPLFLDDEGRALDAFPLKFTGELWRPRVLFPVLIHESF